jgi:serine/threonine protein kinase
VKLIKNESADQLYAAHIFKVPEFSLFFNAEVQNFQSIASNCCVSLVESSPDGIYLKKNSMQYRCMYFVVEFLSFGNVVDLACGPHPLSDLTLRFLFKGMLTSLQELHDSNLCHRTIGPLNILFDDDLIPKFSGLAYAEQISSTTRSMITSKKFLAPEVLSKQESYNGEHSDLFSLGVVMFYMKILKQPFFSASMVDLHYRLFSKDKCKYWKGFSKTSKIDPGFCVFIEKLLDFEPTNRGSVTEALSHPWLAGETGSRESVKEEIEMRRQEMLKRGYLVKVSSRLVDISPAGFRSSYDDIKSDSLEFIKVKPVFNIFLNKSNIIYTTIPPKELMMKVSQYLIQIRNGTKIKMSTEFVQLRASISIYKEVLKMKCLVYEIDESSALEVQLIKGNDFDFYDLVYQLKNNIYPST